MHESYRKWKNRLHKKYQKYSTDEERLQHVPKELNAETWKEMFAVFRSNEFQELSAINISNRAAQTCVASTGPIRFSQVQYDLIDDENGELPKASEVWEATHGILDRDGQKRFRDSKSREIYDDMRRIECAPTNEDEPVPSPDQVFLQVSGVKSGYVRGKGLGYKASKRGMRGIVSNNTDEVRSLKDEVARLTAELKAHEEYRKQLDLLAKKVDILFGQNNMGRTQWIGGTFGGTFILNLIILENLNFWVILEFFLSRLIYIVKVHLRIFYLDIPLIERDDCLLF